MIQRKTLKDLNLLDRFLFAEAMSDPENMKNVLEIILGKDIGTSTNFGHTTFCPLITNEITDS